MTRPEGYWWLDDYSATCSRKKLLHGIPLNNCEGLKYSPCKRGLKGRAIWQLGKPKAFPVKAGVKGSTLVMIAILVRILRVSGG